MRLAFLVNVEVDPHPAAGGRASGTLTHLLTRATTWDAAELSAGVYPEALRRAWCFGSPKINPVFRSGPAGVGFEPEMAVLRAGSQKKIQDLAHH